MKIAVIGAGVVGICTAYELALDGHAVSVFERHAAVAEEASFACAGHLSPSLSHQLSFPAWPQASRLRAPQMREVAPATGLVEHSFDDHREVKEAIAELRKLDASSDALRNGLAEFYSTDQTRGYR